MRIVTRLILFLTIGLSVALAQTVKPIRLLGVDVKGNHLTAETVVKYTAGLVVGKEIQGGDFGKSVRKLWDTGLFSDVQIRLTRETEEGIYVIIEVEENPILGEVKIKGAKKKEKDIREELSLTTGQRIQPHFLKKSIETIKKFYRSDGYLRAEVEAELSDASLPSVKDVTFDIRENGKIKIKDIRFVGNQAFSARKLRRQMKDTKIQKWYLFWRSHFEEDKFEEDKGKLASFYRSNGFRDFRILSESVDYTDDDRRMILEFKVYEGPRYHFRDFSWEGNSLYADDELEGVLGLAGGDVYNEEEFNKGVFERTQGLYMDRGYIYSRIDPQVTPVGEDSLDINFVITEGQQVSVRRIDITGNAKTRENVIRRELMIMPGDIFSRDLLMRSVRQIMILNYFSDVRPDVVPLDEDEIDLLITVEERSSDQANASIGFTGEYGITGGAGVQFNNFRGKGQQLALSFQQGTRFSLYGGRKPAKYQSLSLSFTDPMVNDTPVLVGFSVFYYLRGRGGQDVYYTFPLDREVAGGSVRLGRRLKWPDNFFRASWMIQGSQKTYKGEPEDLERYLGGIDRTVGLSITQFVTRDSRNHAEFPSMGSSFSWTSTLSGGPFDTRWLPVHENFHKHMLRFDWYTPAFWKVVLASSLRMGAIKEIIMPDDRLSIIPLDERFIMGGSGIPYGIMLRGYEDNTVGPHDGRPLGGNVMLKYTAEFRISFSENPTVYGLLFAEMGNVWKDFSETDPFDLKRSAGFGIRMFMPMLGMLGFDLGYGFDDVPATTEKSPEGWNFHILFGMPF